MKLPRWMDEIEIRPFGRSIDTTLSCGFLKITTSTGVPSFYLWIEWTYSSTSLEIGPNLW